jgi:imidazole glycerol-phosphate synthase subunit HisH
MAQPNTVAVVDYGMGNLRSVSQAVQHVAQGSGVEVVVTSRAEDVMNAGRVVLPGQGAIADCMRELADSGMLEAVLHAAAHKPLFGVCVGMQMLLTHSQEGQPGDGGAGTRGLDLIPGEVLKFDLAGCTQPDGSRF